MVKHSEPILKVVCFVLGSLCLFQLSIVAFRNRPLDHLSIPDLPHLPASGETQPGGSGTNLVARQGSSPKTTNAAAIPPSASAPTNSISNRLAHAAETNLPSRAASGPGITSPVSSSNLTATATNSSQTPPVAKTGGKLGPGPGPTTKPPDLPPQIQARIDRITQSEILGTVMRPLPMGLLGIAGNVAFLRAANGQTGMVKEGDQLGGMKLVRIGINRVLIEHEGQTRELTLFSGFGSETLLQKTNETPNETITKSR